MHQHKKYSKCKSRTHQENLSSDEHKLICYLRNRKRRAMGQQIEFKVVINNGISIKPIREVEVNA